MKLKGFGWFEIQIFKGKNKFERKNWKIEKLEYNTRREEAWN